MRLNDVNQPYLFITSMQFMEEGSRLLEYKPDQLKDSLDFIFNGFLRYHETPIIQRNVFKCLVEVGQNASGQFTEPTFEMYLSFIENNAALINKDNCSSAMEGICSL